MTQKRHKILVLDSDLDAAQSLKSILSSYYDVTIADSSIEAAEKTENDDFDILITGYIIPGASGADLSSTVKTMESMIAKEKSNLLSRLSDFVEQVERNTREKKSLTEDLIRDSQEKQDKILKMLSDHVQKAEIDRAGLLVDVRSFKEKYENTLEEKNVAEKNALTFLKEKEDAEDQFAVLLKSKEQIEEELSKIKNEMSRKIVDLQNEVSKVKYESSGLNSKVESLTKQLDNALEDAQKAFEERDNAKYKLSLLQANWEKYISGR